MVWKSHTKVASGYWEKDATAGKSWVVFWYCPGSTKGTDYKKHFKAGTPPTPDQVGAACMKKDTAAPPTFTEYNECFNTIQLKETNKLRYQHISDSVSVDDKLAGLLHK